MLGIRFHGGDLGLGARNRLRHLDQVVADAVDGLDRALPAHCCLDAVERLQEHGGVGAAVAPGVFGEEPAPARGLHHGAFDRLVIGFAYGGKIGHSNGPSVCEM